jgi:hypothetical protein
MDIFDILTGISKRKMVFMQTDMSENDALVKAESEVSQEYHIPLLDIKKLFGVRFIPTGLDEMRNKGPV